MGAGHFPDLDEVLARADVIEKKHKDLRSAQAMRKIVGELRQHRMGQPMPSDAVTARPGDSPTPVPEA
jgi:hypothetical protein